MIVGASLEGRNWPGVTLSTGPSASAEFVPLYDRIRSMDVLVPAWHAIRRNAETSQQEKTKHAARMFGENLPSNLRRIQARLRKGYRFAPAYGAMVAKGSGKIGTRPLVVACLEDRIVQRAILDVLQGATELTGVQRVLQTATSVGGIPGRGVDHAIRLFDDRVKKGDCFVAGSDISGFFTKIPRQVVIEFFRKEQIEAEFIKLIEDALTVELSNTEQLSDADRKLFPIGPDGVAQGCPLSSLAGNIVLERFDQEMNARGITCIRYIDDFILVGKTLVAVKKAMSSAGRFLADLNMNIYDPEKDPKKAFVGRVGEGHIFLGYELLPGSYPPAKAAQEKLISQLQMLIANGQRSIYKAIKHRELNKQDRCYAQTLVAIDRTVHGWRASFRLSKCPEVFERLDREIDRRLQSFRSFYLQKVARASQAQKRRAMGIGLLSEA